MNTATTKVFEISKKIISKMEIDTDKLGDAIGLEVLSDTNPSDLEMGFLEEAIEKHLVAQAKKMAAEIIGSIEQICDL